MIKLEKVSKKFGLGSVALSDINLLVEKGEFVFLVGPTGSGKTTIFRLITRELLPSEGSIIIDEWDITRLPKQKIQHLRKKVGVVFQDLKLLTDRTIFENVALPLEVIGIKPEEAKTRVEGVLSSVGILPHKDKFPIQLSGGELQRAAIARALILSPDIILADEPTGNLDDNTSWEIVKLLSAINEKGTTIIMATHNSEIIKKLSKRVIALEKGKIARDDKSKSVSTHKEEKPKEEQDKAGKDKDKEEKKEA
ncbi:MAG: cell division ATP-binding protein FtsE [Candidatus Levyibacteriota bacterium]